ncbi:uncharacterized protein LOC117123603 isoform X2 [Anneissia japonica]|uniref:uncharacterized protein LOC117123603 isoform X1 n=1 Tax=Anneissia japonica TaxID=1529436 RepID=UPI0014256B8B|nr:uncharacterized protein LOC117123603 isoform X1 [Anneissia japonica]XP_033125488.1 uncharacterized protein LOC117123603 isoform X2 [Anneissia japonica]
MCYTDEPYRLANMMISLLVLAFYITVFVQPTLSLEFHPKNELLIAPDFFLPEDSIHNSEVTVVWGRPSGIVDGYYLVYYDCTTPHIRVTVNLHKNATKYVIINLHPDTTYMMYMLTYSQIKPRYEYYDKESNTTLKNFKKEERYSKSSDMFPFRTPLRGARSTTTTEEVIILITVFLLWILVIALFFRQWGVIRDLQPRSSGGKYRCANTDISRESSRRSAKSPRESVRDRESIRDRDSIRQDSLREREPFLDRVSLKEKQDLIAEMSTEKKTIVDTEFCVDVHYDCEHPDSEERELDSNV